MLYFKLSPTISPVEGFTSQQYLPLRFRRELCLRPPVSAAYPVSRRFDPCFTIRVRLGRRLGKQIWHPASIFSLRSAFDGDVRGDRSAPFRDLLARRAHAAHPARSGDSHVPRRPLDRYCFRNERPGAPWKNVADPARLERTTFAFGGRRSIQLSYGSFKRLLTRIRRKQNPRRAHSLLRKFGSVAGRGLKSEGGAVRMPLAKSSGTTPIALHPFPPKCGRAAICGSGSIAYEEGNGGALPLSLAGSNPESKFPKPATPSEGAKSGSP